MEARAIGPVKPGIYKVTVKVDDSGNSQVLKVAEKKDKGPLHNFAHQIKDGLNI